MDRAKAPGLVCSLLAFSVCSMQALSPKPSPAFNPARLQHLLSCLSWEVPRGCLTPIPLIVEVVDFHTGWAKSWHKWYEAPAAFHPSPGIDAGLWAPACSPETLVASTLWPRDLSQPGESLSSSFILANTKTDGCVWIGACSEARANRCCWNSPAWCRCLRPDGTKKVGVLQGGHVGGSQGHALGRQLAAQPLPCLLAHL